MDYNYTVTLTADGGETVVIAHVATVGNITPSITVELEGYECEEVQVEITLPGNCAPAIITASMLLGIIIYNNLISNLLLL